MSRLERIVLHGSVTAVAISGLVYGVVKYFVPHSDPFSAFNHPLQPWALRLHVLAAPVMVFVLGVIMRSHILEKLRDRRNRFNRRSGVAALALLLPMIVSGYALQVLSLRWLWVTAVVIHVTSSLAFSGFYVAHLAADVRRRRHVNRARAVLQSLRAPQRLRRQLPAVAVCSPRSAEGAASDLRRPRAGSGQNAPVDRGSL